MQLEHLEIITIIGSIIGAVLASWGGVFLNNRYQFKVQKENYERQIRTKVLTNAAKAIVNTRLILLRLPTMPIDKVNDYLARNTTPPELILWTTSKTTQTALDWAVVMTEEIVYLTSLKRVIHKKELEIIDSENSYSDKLRNEIHDLRKQFSAKCQRSYLKTEIAEIKVIACIREELGVSFNEAEYHKMIEAYNRRSLEIINRHRHDSH